MLQSVTRCWIREASPYLERSKCVSHLSLKGDKSDHAKYRPISLTCVLCKVLEYVVTSNLANSNILFELHHGFREKRSCETQLKIPWRDIFTYYLSLITYYLLLITYYLLLITYYLSLITYYLLLIISFITPIKAGNSIVHSL